MVGGAVIVGLCLLVLGWTKEIVGLFVTEPSTVGSGRIGGVRQALSLTFARGGMRLLPLRC